MAADNTPNYKDTLNLPNTAFPMKGNLPQTEPERLKKWEDQNTYEKMLDRNAGRPKFVMPDGPPYANGNIHVGHVLNKVLKDIVIKYKNMQGYQAAFVPGWDCHGLPIELKVTKKLGPKRKELSDKQVRDLCRKEALHWVEQQRSQFQRLGVFADWENPYLTLNAEYEAAEVRVLAKILDNGILYRGEKPVYWCPALQTALAAAEVEYHDHTSPSIYVKFYLNAPESASLPGDKPVAFVIWTTTPWTLPANYAIALNGQFEYGVFDAGAEYLIVATDLKENVEKDTGLTLKLVQPLKGDSLEGLSAQHPFMDRESQIILGDHVTLEAGTSCVHTAPGHGLEDYVVGLKYQLPVHSPVDPAGRYTKDVPQYEGQSIWDANKTIVEDLKKSNHLLAHKDIVHSYPHNPRSKTPLIFRSTPQWFIRMDDKKFSLRNKALGYVDETIEFFPAWGKQRLQAMLSHAPDWCLSRQRIWGVPIPVFYCEKCDEALVSSKIMHRVADAMESSQKGIEAYHDEDIATFVGDEACASCGEKQFRRGMDILDVWFDSGVCHTAVQKQRTELDFPADIYLEGSDQHRGWFQTSLLSSVAAYDAPPFKALITHGFVNDAQGYKMSKSKGNVVDPADVFKKSGAEILRLWVAYEDYGQDVSAGPEIFTRVTETYRRIRNTLRFLLGNINDFDPVKDQVAFAEMPPLDQWALLRLNELIKTVTASYDNYDFYKVYHALNNYFTVELSATYLDIIKDRLYTWKADGRERRATQTVLHTMATTLSGLMAPILSFLAEETYEYIPGVDTSRSIFTTEFPKPRAEWQNNAVLEDFPEILEVRSEISKVLEDLRREKVIGSSLDAKVTLSAKPARFERLERYKQYLREIFIVSQLEIISAEKNHVEAQRAEGEKCVRCWHYSKELGKIDSLPGVCPKCVEALQ